ncbi:MAG: hypothetical protein IPM12_04565 [Flavobacteriales bacterium]|nr:hypothetical protein [Flavobacteriales bacterium]
MKAALVALLALVLLGTEARAQGDLCTGSTALACGAVVAGNTTAYGVDVAPFCGTTDGTGGGVWYHFVGTGGSITASLCGSAYDTKIRVFTGACTALTCVVGIDDFCGLQSQVTWLSALGVTYRILVHGFGAATGNYTLSITCAAPPVPMCYSQTATPYVADAYAGTPLTMTDDVHSAVINMGFSFCYNSTAYTQCVISSNNYVTFNLANAGTYSPWPTVPVPAVTPAQITNSVLNPWQDIHPGLCAAPGCVYYQTLGVAPFRRFVVSYLNVPMFSCTAQRYSSQTVLYESTNCIGSFILEKNICAAWNGGNAVHALHNNGGTSASVVPGRNNTQWLAAAQGMFFVPTCAPCSTATTAQCLSMILPVELLEFRGRNEGAVNILEWATASEQNSAHFIVERSLENGWFEPVAQVEAAGHSAGLMEYRAVDPSPLRGDNYYRLRQVDADGREELSEAIMVRHVPANTLMVVHDPAQGVLLFNLGFDPEFPVRLAITDPAGRMVKHILAAGRTGSIPMQDLAPGIYLLTHAAFGVGAARFMVE